MRHRPTIAIAALFLACVPFSISAKPADRPPLVIGEPLAHIPIVHTAKELKKLQPISVGDYEVHLGIEKDKCSVGQGTLVYLLLEKNPNQMRQFTLRYRQLVLGPLILDIEPEEKEIPESDSMCHVLPAVHQDGALYVAAVQPAMAGKYSIRVKTADGTTLARATLAVDDEKTDQPWFQLDDLTEKHKDAEKNEFFAEFSPWHNCPAWDGSTPFPIPDGELPTMMPERETDDIKIEAAENGVLKISGKNLSRQWDEDYLVRLWVDDKPVSVPDIAMTDLKDKLNKLTEQNDSDLLLHLDFSVFRFKEGDKVTVQLACCPFGVRRMEIGNLMMADQMKRAIDADNMSIRLSKKITITLGKQSRQPLKKEIVDDNAAPSEDSE